MPDLLQSSASLFGDIAMVNIVTTAAQDWSFGGGRAGIAAVAADA